MSEQWIELRYCHVRPAVCSLDQCHEGAPEPRWRFAVLTKAKQTRWRLNGPGVGCIRDTVTRCGKSKKVLCQPVRIEGMKHFVVFIVLLRRQIRGSVFFDDSVRIF